MDAPSQSEADPAHTKQANSKFELIETIRQQDELISRQAETIFSLVNETVEQESIINELMRGVVG